MNGWTGKIIRVNLTEESIVTEDLNMLDAKMYLGGRGLGTKIFMHEVDPKIDALSPENKLIFMSGPLTGTLAACAARFEIVAKSPLTGTIGSCSSGGFFGPVMKFAGYDGIILEGKASKPVYLFVNDDHIELRDASHLWGKKVSATTSALINETDDDAKVACIGPAGEKLVLFASIMNDKNRAAGRSGLGAVMGSKNLKAIVVKGTKSIKVAKRKEFLDSCFDGRYKLKVSGVTCTGLPSYGTEILENTTNVMGTHPTRNWQQTAYFKSTDVHGETSSKNSLVRNRGCFDCSIGCAKISDTVEETSADFGELPEYEAGWSFGSNCGTNDLASVCEANILCDEFGMDPISMGATIACAMELRERGYIKKEDIGMDLRFGNENAIVELTRKTGCREGFGDKLALGSYRMAEGFGHPELSMSVKKQEIPAYEGPPMQGINLEYATSNSGGCHVRGFISITEKHGIHEIINASSGEGRAASLKFIQDLTSVVDSVGICLFTTYAIGLPEISEMLRTCTGINYTDEEVLQVGERIWNLEKIFNLKCGFNKADDALPARLLNDSLTVGTGKVETSELDEMLPEYYSIRGWDEAGIPTEEKKRELMIE